MKKACIFLCILISSFCFSQQKPLDSILPTITKPADSIVFDKAMRFFQKIWAEQKYDIALSYEDILVSLSKSIDYDRGTGDVYNHIGTIYNTTDKYIKAFHNYDKAAICYKKANFERGLAIINNNKGTIEQKRGNDENAVNYLHEANLYFIRTNDSVVLSSTYNNIGNAYSALHNLQLAKEYYIKSIALKRSLKSKKLGGTLNNLALVYIDLKKLDSAKIFLRESLVISKKNNKISSIASAYSRLGSIALMNKDYKKSKKYYDSSYTTAQKEKNEVILASAKQQLGVIAMKTNNFREARTLLEDARQQFKALESTPLLLINYEQSAKLDSARGNFKSAFEWQKRYTQLLEESKSNETAQKIEIAETRFESEMEQLTLIDEQEKREQQNNNELFKYRVFTYISLYITIIILIFLAYIIKTRKERKQYVKELNESNQVKNKLFSIISHDLKNEIHGLDSTLNLLGDNTISTAEFKETIPILADSTHQTSILLNNLLNWSKSQLKELNAKPIAFDINEVIIDKFTFFEPKAESKNIELTNKLGPTLVFADKDMFAIVSQNLIANAIKFCNSGDSITLTAKEKEQHYEICFEDTGVGIAQENIDKLFAEDTFTTNGTQQETGTGLGLKICKELIELNKGTIMVDSTLGKGSVFCITLPKEA